MCGQREHIRGHPAECPYDEPAVWSVICHSRRTNEPDASDSGCFVPLHDYCRVTRNDRHRWHVTRNDTPGCDDGACADGYAGQDQAVGTDPHVVAQHDWFCVAFRVDTCGYVIKAEIVSAAVDDVRVGGLAR